MTQLPGANLIITGVFLLSLLTLGAGAVLAVSSQRLMRSVCGLAISCVGLAGLYYFLHSPFLALMEVLIYIGAVCVTMVFAIMLAEPGEPANEEKPGQAIFRNSLALMVAVAILWGLWRLGQSTTWAPPAGPVAEGALPAVGTALLTTYSLAFELISVLLLAAILGALAIARTGRSK